MLWITERKHTALSKAINKFELTIAKLKAINAKMQEDIPRKDSAIAVREEWFEKLQKAQ